MLLLCQSCRPLREAPLLLLRAAQVLLLAAALELLQCVLTG